MNDIRRISIFSGPCGGKSTATSWLFAELKKRHFNIELVTEYAKKWTYIDRNPKSYEQYFISGKQVYNEYMPLQSGFDYIISDSPVFLSCFYAKYNKAKFVKELVAMVKVYDREYPSLNILLDRDNTNFSQVGRFHNLEQSQEIDKKLKKFLVDNGVKFYSFNNYELGDILKFILSYIGKS